ncbi:unnamed protein product [Arctia plantaginis]|uniref:Lipid droplet-associated hydrolase n=1 Tax=Arctia plantaginis TaxID=874455 RepID=A0A8S1BDB4_ARCPL|nr:unnamed protein product [Arctia plantaginis]
MSNEYVSLNHVQTHLITWGNPFNCGGQDVIICVTGNPGITDFYIDFGSQLNKNTELPVCVIGQAGHEEVPDEKSNILKGQEHLFNLKGQIAHKLDLINNFIDRESRLHLIGHSIGACTRDDWAPINYIDDLQMFQPQIRLEKVDIEHAFVLKSSEIVAEKVSNFIKSTT